MTDFEWWCAAYLAALSGQCPGSAPTFADHAVADRNKARLAHSPRETQWEAVLPLKDQSTSPYR